MVDNPYLCQGPVEDSERFYGRSADIDEAVQLIGKGQCVSLVGLCGTGKTSFLLRLYSLSRDSLEDVRKDILYVYIDGQMHRQTRPSEFYYEVLCAIRSQLAQHAAFAQLGERSGDQGGFGELRRMSLSLSRRGIRSVLLIDTFDVLSQNRHFDFAFFGRLRSLAPLGAVYVTASRRRLFRLGIDANTLGSPFFNIFHTLYLGSFDSESAQQLIREPAIKYGVQFDDRVVSTISNLAGNHPLFLQHVCHVAFEMYREGKGGAARESLALLRSRSYKALEEQMGHYWSDLETGEQQVLSRVACGKVLQKDALPDADALVRRGVLSRVDGHYQVFSTLLRDYVRQQAIAAPAHDRDRSS